MHKSLLVSPALSVRCALSARLFNGASRISAVAAQERVTRFYYHQENSMSLDWLEPVSPVIPARQCMSWIYPDMPESSTCAGAENHWYQLLALDLVCSPDTSCFPFAHFHTYRTEIVIII